MKLEAIHIDGGLYVAIGFLTAFIGAVASDEAAKYITPSLLFWMKTGGTCALAGVASLKMFRSTAFGEHLKRKGETEMLTRAQAGLGPLQK